MLEKLLILIISLFLVLLAGAANIYPIYLQKLMDRYNFTLNEINLYGSFVTLGVWIGFPIGLIYDSYGPKISTFLGTTLISGGYLFLHFILTLDIFSHLSIYPLLILGFIIGQGNSLLYTTAITTNLKNFRFKQNSSIVGLLVANFAISPSIFTTYRESLSEVNSKNFYLYFSFFLFLLGVGCMIIINNVEEPYKDDHLLKKYQKHKEKRIILVYMFYNMLAIFIFVFGVLLNYSKDRYVIPLIVIYPILLLLNLVIVIAEQCGVFDNLFYPDFRKKVNFIAQSQIELSNAGNEDMNTGKKNQIRDIKKSETLTSEKEIEFKTAIKSPKLILVFISLMLGLGSTLSNLNNINFILKSLSYKIHYSGLNKGIISIYKVKECFFYVILYFSFNALVRISSGIFIDYLIKKNKFVTYFLIFTVTGLLSQLIGIAMNKSMLYLAIALAGATHGGYMTFVPIFAKNTFGLKNMGKILGLIMAGAGIGSLLVSELVFTLPYNRQAQLDLGMQCFGASCFRLSFVITSTFFLLNLGICFLITII